MANIKKVFKIKIQFSKNISRLQSARSILRLKESNW
jgi:hypothetical protein